MTAAGLSPDAGGSRQELWTAAVLGYAALLLVISVMPLRAPAAVPHLDKVWHLCKYGLFAWLVRRAQRARRQPRPRWRAWLIATGYGLLLEGVQAWLPWRSAEVGDVLANGLGAAVGIWCLPPRARTTHGRTADT
jgi:VanZ family protein